MTVSANLSIHQRAVAGRPQPFPIYCINLERSAHRRSTMEAEFRRVRWEPTFVPAVDGLRTLKVDELILKGSLSTEHSGLFGPMSLTEIGCFMSHERTWRYIRRRKDSYALVCEDDVRFRSPILDPVHLIENLPADCDLLYFFYLEDGLTAPPFDISRDRPVAKVHSYDIFSAWSCGGCQCYLITASGVNKVLNFQRPIKFPVDGYLARLSATGQLKCYALNPMAVEHDGLPSTVR